MPLITHRLRQRPAFDSGHCHDDMAARRDVGREIGPRETRARFFLIGLEQHPYIDGYITEFLDDHCLIKHADVVFRSAISHSADAASRADQNIRLRCRLNRRLFDSVSGYANSHKTPRTGNLSTKPGIVPAQKCVARPVGRPWNFSRAAVF